jgi:Ca2+-binding EF-hand superfamily protein
MQQRVTQPLEEKNMSSINGINNTATGSILSQGMRSRPDPAEKFQKLDADASGSLDKTELSELAKELSKMVGKTLDVDASITTYDTDGDGVLNQQETDTMLRATMGPPPAGGSGPPDKAERFKELDSDASGGLNQEELDVMAEDLAAMTGLSVDMSAAISTYDTDGDGELNEKEIDSMMQETMKPPPKTPERIGGTSAQQISNAYLANSGEDQLSLVQKLLDKLAEDLSTGNGTTSTT